MKDSFESKLKEEFDKLEKDYDGWQSRLQLVLNSIRDSYVCDCEKNYGKNCKYPGKYRDGGCK